MIIMQKVDLHTPKLEKLNEVINAGYKLVAWVPYNNRMVVFLEGPVVQTPMVQTPTIVDTDTGERTYNALSETTDASCMGTTVAGNPCKGSRFDGTEYCVAHQDQG